MFLVSRLSKLERDTRNRSPPRSDSGRGERGSGGEGANCVQYQRYSCVSNTLCPSSQALLPGRPGRRGQESIRSSGLTSQMPEVSSTIAVSSGWAYAGTRTRKSKGLDEYEYHCVEYEYEYEKCTVQTSHPDDSLSAENVWVVDDRLVWIESVKASKRSAMQSLPR